jgi:hypothetical protein
VKSSGGQRPALMETVLRSLRARSSHFQCNDLARSAVLSNSHEPQKPVRLHRFWASFRSIDGFNSYKMSVAGQGSQETALIIPSYPARQAGSCLSAGTVLRRISMRCLV